MSNPGIPVEWRGTVYPSRAALAKALNRSRQWVSRAINHGDPLTLGAGAGSGRERAAEARKQPVASLGHSWPSQRACARALGVPDDRVSRHLMNGTLDTLVREKLGPKHG